MRYRMIGMRAAAIALVVVSGFVVSASASAATVTSVSGSRGAHAGAVSKARYDIMTASCSVDKSYVHVTFSTGTKCYSGIGTLRFTTVNSVTKVCSGNNFGSIVYQVSGVNHTWNFSQGQTKTFSPGVFLTTLTINGFSGSETC